MEKGNEHFGSIFTFRFFACVTRKSYLIDLVKVHNASLTPLDVLSAFHVQLVQNRLDVLAYVASLEGAIGQRAGSEK